MTAVRNRTGVVLSSSCFRFSAVCLTLLILAFALRWPNLRSRPMHNDEAVNAVKFGQLWEKGTYTYDPEEHHGPALFYASRVILWVTGAPPYSDIGERRFRFVPMIFGLGLIALVPLL